MTNNGPGIVGLGGGGNTCTDRGALSRQRGTDFTSIAEEFWCPFGMIVAERNGLSNSVKLL